MSVVHIIFVLFLFSAAVAIRMAGNSTVLNFVSYSRVPDRRRLHVWVGNRLLLVSLLASVIAAFAWVRQELAVTLLFAQVAVVFITVVAIVAGSSKFTKIPPSPGAA